MKHLKARQCQTTTDSSQGIPASKSGAKTWPSRLWSQKTSTPLDATWYTSIRPLRNCTIKARPGSSRRSCKSRTYPMSCNRRAFQPSTQRISDIAFCKRRFLGSRALMEIVPRKMAKLHRTFITRMSSLCSQVRFIGKDYCPWWIISSSLQGGRFISSSKHRFTKGRPTITIM